MQENVPKYKLCTAEPVDRTESLDYFTKFLSKKTLYKDKEAYLCIDDSLLIFHSSGIENLVFVEMHCSVIAIPGTGRIVLKAVANFVRFCVKQKTDIKIVRYKKRCVVSPSGGNLMSDLLSSSAYTKATHYAMQGYRCPKNCNPKVLETKVSKEKSNFPCYSKIVVSKIL